MRVPAVLGIWIVMVAALGCGRPGSFPDQPIREPHSSPGRTAYDTNHDGRADFFTFTGSSGRIEAVACDNPENPIRLDDLPTADCPHLVIILDGFGYDVVREFYEQGGLRYCHPPSRVVCPYPGLTDLALNDALGTGPSDGFEALYYDGRKNRLVGGSMAYLHGDNMPYNRVLQYRAGLLTDVFGYLGPWGQFENELRETRRVFQTAKSRETLVYFVTSAGVGTKWGKEGQLRALKEIDRWVNEEYWRRRGRVKVTLFADHGHSYTPAKRIGLEKHLRDKGWRLRDRLEKPNDVVYIRFGLETYASFATKSPGKLACDLIEAEGVELASFTDGDAVTVLGRGRGKAYVRTDGRGYSYETLAYDPLKLQPTLAKLTPRQGRFYDADALLAATIDAPYPAALERLWRAHKGGLARNTPDVIVSLADAYFSGSEAFSGSVKVASTHGGLNRRNSVTFIMSSLGPLPPILRSREIPAALKTALHTDAWPTGK